MNPRLSKWKHDTVSKVQLRLVGKLFSNVNGICVENYIYIYIYAGELVLVPLFGLSRVSFGTTSRVRNSTTSWGAHFRTTKIGFFEDFCDKFWCQLVFLCFVFWAQLVSSHLLFSILLFFCFLGNRGPKFRLFFDIVFQKNTIKIGFF